MKKIFFFTLFCLGSLLIVPCSNAQGNLQFNQVLNPSISTTSLFLANTAQQVILTIPAGKVWKIESASFVTLNTSTNPGQLYPAISGGSGNGAVFFIDDFIVATYYNSSNSSVGDPIFPIWLNAGTHTIKISNNSSNNYNSGAIWRGTLSVLEFNIIP